MHETTTATTANQPIKSFRDGDLSVSIWENRTQRNGEPRTFYKATITKSYKKGEEYKRTTSFAPEDFATIAALLKQAGTFIENLEFPELEDLNEEIDELRRPEAEPAAKAPSPANPRASRTRKAS